jgi:hypothetical protein
MTGVVLCVSELVTMPINAMQLRSVIGAEGDITSQFATSLHLKYLQAVARKVAQRSKKGPKEMRIKFQP